MNYLIVFPLQMILLLLDNVSIKSDKSLIIECSKISLTVSWIFNSLEMLSDKLMADKESIPISNKLSSILDII